MRQPVKNRKPEAVRHSPDCASRMGPICDCGALRRAIGAGIQGRVAAQWERHLAAIDAAKSRPGPYVIGLDYALASYLRFSLARRDGKWAIYEEIGGGSSPDIQLMSGERAGGTFDTFEGAEAELLRILRSIQAPLTPREIRHHFTVAWMRREGQRKALRRFRDALLRNDLGAAFMIYEREFSNYTREAIPGKVLYHLERAQAG